MRCLVGVLDLLCSFPSAVRRQLLGVVLEEARPWGNGELQKTQEVLVDVSSRTEGNPCDADTLPLQLRGVE